MTGRRETAVKQQDPPGLGHVAQAETSSAQNEKPTRSDLSDDALDEKPCLVDTERSPRMDTVGPQQEMAVDTNPTPVQSLVGTPIQAENNSGPSKLVSGQRKSWYMRFEESAVPSGNNNVAQDILSEHITHVYYSPTGRN